MNLASLIPSVAAPQVTPPGHGCCREGGRSVGETPDADGVRSSGDHPAKEDKPDFADDLKDCLEKADAAAPPAAQSNVDAPAAPAPAPAAEKPREAKALLEELFPALNPLLAGPMAAALPVALPVAAQALAGAPLLNPAVAALAANPAAAVPGGTVGEGRVPQGAPTFVLPQVVPPQKGGPDDPIVSIDGASTEVEPPALTPVNQAIVGQTEILPEITTTPTTPTTPTEGAAGLSILREETANTVLSNANAVIEPKVKGEIPASGSNAFQDLLTPARAERAEAPLGLAVAEAAHAALRDEAETGRGGGKEAAPPAPSEAVHAVLQAAGRPVGEASATRAPAVADQVGQAILTRAETVAHAGKTEFHLQLDPPELGSVRVHLTATEHSVSARLVVQDASARQLLESQLHYLRQRLEEAGINVGRFDVMHDHGGGGQNLPQHQAPATFAALGAPSAGWSPEAAPRIPEATSSSRRLVDVLA